MKDYHVVVAGGGPAGLASAIGFARKGLDVLLVERRPYPVDKTCGEGIQPPGIAALQRLGVFERIPEDARREIRGIQYFSGNVQARADFAEGPGSGVRRTLLSDFLFRAAVEAGVTIVRKNLREILPEYAEYASTGKLPALDIRTRLLVGADGLDSLVRKWSGLEETGAAFHRYGIRRHFSVPDDSLPHYVEVHAGYLCEAYITPTGKAELQIAFLWHREKFRERPHNVYQALLSEFPALQRYSGSPVGRPSGAGLLWKKSGGTTARGVILVGDAAGYMDALTGEGLSIGFKEAEAAQFLSTELGARGAPLDVSLLKPYSAACRRITANYRLTTRLLLFLSRRPSLIRNVIRFLSGRPKLLQTLLSVNMGTRRPSSVLAALARDLF